MPPAVLAKRLARCGNPSLTKMRYRFGFQKSCGRVACLPQPVGTSCPKKKYQPMTSMITTRAPKQKFGVRRELAHHDTRSNWSSQSSWLISNASRSMSVHANFSTMSAYTTEHRTCRFKNLIIALVGSFRRASSVISAFNRLKRLASDGQLPALTDLAGGPENHSRRFSNTRVGPSS